MEMVPSNAKTNVDKKIGYFVMSDSTRLRFSQERNPLQMYWKMMTMETIWMMRPARET